MRNSKVLFYLASMLLLLVSGNGMAQYLSVPYSMDFEVAEQAEINNWVLNPGSPATAKEKWVIGNSTHSAGRRALYISADNGVSTSYTTTKDVQYVYRDLMLPAGKYIFSFDWKCKGSTKSTLSAGYALASQLTSMTALTNTGTIPNTILNKCNATMKQKYGEENWRNAAFQIQSNGTDATRIFFVWANAETDSAAIDLGACIDNIQITTTACPRPENLNATTNSCDEVLFTWTGSSADYEVAYRLVGTDIWNICYDVTASGNTGVAKLTGMNEGSYDFRVRGICTPDTSAWNYLTGFVVYCEELHCINFTDLYAPNVVCTSGTTTSAGFEATSGNAYTKRGVIDYGPDDKRSRHTVNSDPTATDPRTGGALPIIPAGSKFSVRLGNWEYSYGAEAISYTYTVDTTMAILLLQYAVVLEDPDHDDDDQPRFLLEVLKDGQLLDATCGMRNFTPRADWVSVGTGYDKVTYKPWTTVGLNLNELGVDDGDRITVRLTTYDCFMGGHYGYAYFTLDCASPTIQTHSCAKDKSSAAVGMELTAPAGFRYQWLDHRHRPIPGETNNVFYPTDTSTYFCRLTSTENASCTFELESRCVPRLPIPEFKLNYEPKDCKNIVRISNTSHPRIVLKDRAYDERGQKCDSYEWQYWGDNFPIQTTNRDSFKVTLPQDGGTFTFTLKAELEGGCDSIMTKTIRLPKIGDSEIHEEAALCEHSGVWFFDQYITYESISGQDTVVELGGKSLAGCDSLVNMYIYKAPSYSITLDTVEVYEGGWYEFAGEKIAINESKLYYANLQTVHGCDSMVMQYIKMVPCYNLIYQRWDDVLSVMNENAQVAQTPGVVPVRCIAFQWLKDHMPIEGEIDSYYYAPGGLEADHEYSVLVTLENGEQYETCALTPVLSAKAPAAARKVLRDGTLYIEKDDVLYDMYGRKYVR